MNFKTLMISVIFIHIFTSLLQSVVFCYNIYGHICLCFSKIDEAFYSSRIRVNGMKVLKKAKEVSLCICGKTIVVFQIYLHI